MSSDSNKRLVAYEQAVHQMPHWDEWVSLKDDKFSEAVSDMIPKVLRGSKVRKTAAAELLVRKDVIGGQLLIMSHRA